MMRTIRANWEDPQLQGVDQEHQFLWVFTWHYQRVKKEGPLTREFWEGLKGVLPEFEMPSASPPLCCLSSTLLPIHPCVPHHSSPISAKSQNPAGDPSLVSRPAHHQFGQPVNAAGFGR
jgi:hypothetical protein